MEKTIFEKSLNQKENSFSNNFLKKEEETR